MSGHEEEVKCCLDLNPKHVVEVLVKNNKLWVNVDGLCRLRASACPEIIIQDERLGTQPETKR